MIPKISRGFQSLPSEFPLQKASSADYPLYRSSLTSLQVSSLYSWIPALLNQIWWMIKSLFCCYRYPIHHHTEFKPEIDPKILSTRDPFYQTLYNSNHTLRNPQAYQLGCEIFDILGEGGWIHWLSHRKTIEKKKDEILDYDVHPLESLYFLFHNQPMTQLVCHFLDNASFGIGKKFRQEYAARFKAYSNPIKPQIPGFCKLLNLDKKHVTNLVKKQNWQELIQYVHKIRENHFKAKDL